MSGWVEFKDSKYKIAFEKIRSVTDTNETDWYILEDRHGNVLEYVEVEAVSYIRLY